MHTRCPVSWTAAAWSSQTADATSGPVTDYISALAASECRLLCFRHDSNGSSSRVAKAAAALGQELDVEFSHDVRHVQQIQQLEKRLFAKSDGWRGGLFEGQLKKRNTYMLYVLQESKQATADAAHEDTTHSQQYSRCGEVPQQQEPSSAVLGYIVVQVNSVTAHVNKLAVAPEARRTGIATRLLRGVLQLVLKERRIMCATLHVDVSNTPALGLYRKAGFLEDGLIEDYYGQGRHAHKLFVDLQESNAVKAFLNTGC